MTRDFLLTSAEAAQRLLVTTNTLTSWRARGIGPRWIRVVGRVLYRLSDVEGFLAENEYREAA